MIRMHRRVGWCRRRSAAGLGAAAVLLLVVSPCGAEPRLASLPSGALTLPAAVAFALAHHPVLQIQGATADVRRAQVSYARAGYLPDLSISAELERGTGNVLRGSLFAMPNIPPVSGPPTGRGLDRGAWGSAAGIGVSWDALGLVKQMFVVDAALAEASATDAATAVAL